MMVPDNRKAITWRCLLIAIGIFVLLAHNLVWTWSSFRIGGIWGGVETFFSTRYRSIIENPEQFYFALGMPWMLGIVLGAVALAIRSVPFWIGATLVTGAVAFEVFFWIVLIWTGWSS